MIQVEVGIRPTEERDDNEASEPRITRKDANVRRRPGVLVFGAAWRDARYGCSSRLGAAKGN